MNAVKPILANQLGPLRGLEEWDDFVKTRYTEEKKSDEFRDYSETTPPRVREFYRQNHAYQTRDFVLNKKKQFLARNRAQMDIWEAMEFLNTLIDESDPDTELTQIEHLLQTSEAIRRDAKPDWFGVAPDGLRGLQQMLDLRELGVWIALVYQGVEKLHGLPDVHLGAVPGEELFFLVQNEIARLVSVILAVELANARGR